MEYFVDKKMVGEMRDGIFRKIVNPKIHKMRVLDAYGIESNVIEQIKDTCKEIRIKEKGTGTVYRISFKEFMERSFEKNYSTPQRFLRIKDWITNDNTMSLFQ